MHPLKDRFIKLLRWSERYTKTDMVYLAHGGFWLAVSQAVSSVQAFAVTIILANILAPEVLGEYRFGIAALSILLIFALPGMQTAILESTPRGFLGNLALGIRSKFNFGLIGTALALLGSFYYFLQGDVTLTAILIIVGVFVPLFETSALYTQHLQALKAFKRSAVYNIIVRFILMIAMVTTAVLFPTQSILLILAFLSVQTILHFFFSRHIQSALPVEIETDSSLVPYAKHLSFMAAFSIVAMYLDQLLVWEFVGPAELAIFFIAIAIPQEFLRFANIVTILAFPKFSTTDIKVLRATLLPKIAIFFLVISLFVLLYILLCPLIFGRIFPAYEASILYSQILALMMLQAAFLPIRTFFNVTRDTKKLYILSISVPLVRIVIGIALVVPLGIWGVVIAVLAEACARIIIFTSLFVHEKRKLV